MATLVVAMAAAVEAEVAILPAVGAEVAVATAAVVKGVEVPPLRRPRVTVEVVEEVTSLRHPRAEVAILPAVEAEVAESTMLSVAAEAVKRAAALVEAAVIPSAVEAMAAVPLLRHPRATVVAVEVLLLRHPQASQAEVAESTMPLVEAAWEAPPVRHPQASLAAVAILPAVKSAVASTMLSVVVKRVAAMPLLRRPRAEVVPPLWHPRASPQASQAAVEASPL